MEYKPPYTISDRMSFLISQISEKIGYLSVKAGLNSKPHLRRNSKIRSIYSSLRIEANSLSLTEVKDVIEGRLVLGPAKEIQEVKNAYEAYEIIDSIDPYSLKDLKRIHGVMTKYLVHDYGNFRSGEEGVFNDTQCIFMAPPAKFVPELMENLFSWMKANQDRIHPLILSAVFHYEFVFIHPFSDGNGRMGRFWHTLILTKWKSIFEYLPIESQIEKFQDGYYEAISKCHAVGSSNTFIEFMLCQIDSLIDELIKKPILEENYDSIYVKSLISVMEPKVSYSANELLELLGLKSKENLRKYYLDPAISQGLIVRTLPNKLRSKNQRYIKQIE